MWPDLIRQLYNLFQKGVSTMRPTRGGRVVHLDDTSNGNPGLATTLPGSGGYTSQAAWDIPDGTQFVTFWLVYTRGAANGAAKLRVLLGNGNEEGSVTVTDPSVTASQPYNDQNVLPGELLGPAPLDNNPVTYPIVVDVRGGATKFRVLVAEIGVTATPGKALVTLTAGY